MSQNERHEGPTLDPRYSAAAERVRRGLRAWLAEAVPKHGLAPFTILSVALMVYVLPNEPRLVMDDWTLIAEAHVAGSLDWFLAHWHRPLDRAAYKAIALVFGLDPWAFHLVHAALISGCALAVYLLVRELLPDEVPLALSAAILALVYPADLTTGWLVMINNRLAWLLALAGMIWLLRYAKRGGVHRLVMAAVCSFFPLWIYEGGLGIFAAWCFIAAAFAWNAPGPRRVATLVPLVPLAIFVVLRMWVLPDLQVENGNVLAASSVSPADLLARFSKASVLLTAWTTAFRDWWSAVGEVLASNPPEVHPFAVLLPSILVLLSLAAISGASRVTPPERMDRVRRLVDVGILALLVVPFAYVPAIFIFPPNLDSFSSRVNLYPIAPASLAIAALASAIATALTNSNRHRAVVLGVLVAPLVALGVWCQWRVQSQAIETWEAQTRMWERVFELIPDLEDSTTLLFVLPGHTGHAPYGNPLLVANWEATSAVRVLYANASLGAEIHFPDAEIYSEATLTPEGPRRFQRGRLAAWSEVVVIRSSEEGRQVEVVESLPDHVGYSPSSRIRTQTDRRFRYRSLVSRD